MEQQKDPKLTIVREKSIEWFLANNTAHPSAMNWNREMGHSPVNFLNDEIVVKAENFEVGEVVVFEVADRTGQSREEGTTAITYVVEDYDDVAKVLKRRSSIFNKSE